MTLQSHQGLEVRVQRGGDLIEVEDRLAEHGELGVHAQTVVAGLPDQLQQQCAQLELAQGGARRATDHPGDRSLEADGVVVRQLLTHGARGADDLVRPGVRQCEQQLEQLLLVGRGDPRDHPDVEQDQSAVIGDEHVARVRVGVEHALDQDLPDVDTEELVGECGAVQVHLSQRAHVRHLAPRDELHRQDPAGGEVGERLRHHDAIVVPQHGTDGGEVVRLAPVVQLVHEGPSELLEEVADPEPLAQLGVPVDESGEVVEHLHVLQHLGADARTLHLHHDLPAVAERGAVHLPQRGGGEGDVVEVGEHRGEPDAELGADQRLHLREREGRHVVLEPGQRLDVRRADQVHAGREHLPELHEGRPHGFQVVGQPRRGLRVPRVEILVGETGVQPGRPDQVTAAVPGEEQEEIAVARRVAHLEGGGHGLSERSRVGLVDHTMCNRSQRVTEG